MPIDDSSRDLVERMAAEAERKPSLGWTLLVVPDGEGDGLQYFVNKAAPENLVLRLYQSNTTPAETDTAATYTEATFTGYAPITLTGSSWGALQ